MSRSSIPELASAELSPNLVLRRAARGLLRVSESIAAVEPLAGCFVRIRAALGRETDPSPLFEWWRSRSRGNPRSEMRYRWELTHRRGVPMPPYAADERQWHAWRAEEEPLLHRDPFDFESRLLVPIIITENAELLSEAADAGGALADNALELLDEAAPVLRRDFAGFVQAADPWQDTFALFRLVRRPRTLSLLHPLAVAIATNYAAGCVGPVLGTRFPFHARPLVSASAQLASGLLALGSDMTLVGDLIAFVAASRLPNGGFSDGGSPDVLTTLAASDLLACIDPSFDPEATIRWFSERQGDDGLWRALGPDAPWLTFEIMSLIERGTRPFDARFRWPFLAAANRDRKTGLPFYAYYADLAQLFAELAGLSRCHVELAFIDLVGFRAFNNRFGQDRGDEVLRVFARELDSISSTRAIRDGGDEFLLLGAPTRTGLEAAIDEFRRAWPARFAATFGGDVPPVAPRVLLGHTRGAALRHARERLGREIGSMKHDVIPGPEGVLRDAGDCSR